MTNTILSLQDQREKERAFQRKSSVKRKLVKKSVPEVSAAVTPSPSNERVSFASRRKHWNHRLSETTKDPRHLRSLLCIRDLILLQ